jgi:flagellar protein FlgJ
MSISAITSLSSPVDLAQLREANALAGMPAARGSSSQPGPDDVKKAAGQFEAIILRQLLGPSIEPMMSGGLGDSGGSGGGAGVYSYLLTDTLCSSLGSAGGLGLGRMLEKQLSPPAPPADAPLSSFADSTSALSTSDHPRPL